MASAQVGPRGPAGARGATGAQGPKGNVGPMGPMGPRGLAGLQGIQGPKGDKGLTGATGPAGPVSVVTSDIVYKGLWNASINSPTIPEAIPANNGWFYKVAVAGLTVIDGIDSWEAGDSIVSNGATWDKIDNTGIVGLQGQKGDRGDTGTTGLKGDKGDKGDTGLQGAQGLKGDKGDTGEKGDKGDRGDIGLTGLTGAAGDTGLQGAKGDKGDTGLAGSQGIQGIQGLKGDKGDKGDAGIQGPAGADGIGNYGVANSTTNGLMSSSDKVLTDQFNKLRVAIFSDMHFGCENDVDYINWAWTESGLPSLNKVATDINNTIPVDYIFTAGDVSHYSQADFPAIKTWIDTNIRNKGIHFSSISGNHDAEQYGEFGKVLDGTAGSWQTDYPYVQTILSSNISIGATSITTASTVGFSTINEGSPNKIFVWDVVNNVGEGFTVNTILGNIITLNTGKSFARNYSIANCIVFQGRDKNTIFGDTSGVRTYLGKGEDDLGPNGISRVSRWGNNIFITLDYDNWYDGNFSQFPYSQISPTALIWFEQQLIKYQGNNIIVFTHNPIKDSGITLDNTTGIAPNYGNATTWFDGSSIAIKALCAKYTIAAWFSGHKHWSVNNLDINGNPGGGSEVRVSKPVSGFGGCTFIGCPSTGRVRLSTYNGHPTKIAAYKAWWYYTEFVSGSNTLVIKSRNSTDTIWESSFNTTVTLPFPVRTDITVLNTHYHSNKTVIEQITNNHLTALAAIANGFDGGVW